MTGSAPGSAPRRSRTRPEAGAPRPSAGEPVWGRGGAWWARARIVDGGPARDLCPPGARRLPRLLRRHGQAEAGRCTEACYECAQACTACADACLSEEAVDQPRMCIPTDLVHACRCGEGETGTVATSRARDRQPNGCRRTGGRLVGQLSAVPQGSARGQRRSATRDPLRDISSGMPAEARPSPQPVRLTVAGTTCGHCSGSRAGTIVRRPCPGAMAPRRPGPPATVVELTTDRRQAPLIE